MATTSPSITGTWNADTTHSTLEFAARHMVVATFRGRLPSFSARLVGDDAGLRLEGEGDATSIVTEDENLTGHLQSPDFLDTQRNPTVTLVSRSVEVSGEDVTVQADLTMKGITRPVEFRGSIAGPAEDPWGNVRLGLELTGRVERSDYEMEWNAPLPGGGLVLGNTVTLSMHLEFIREA
jgi:polyisoprenoid-binding protein YceI